MKHPYKKSFWVLFALFLCFGIAWTWGPEGHRIINEHACRLMPAPTDRFFLAYAESLGVLGEEPDIWKKEKPELRNWHYIDLDMLDAFPFKEVPLERTKAEKRFGKKKLKEAGGLPWAIEHHYRSLVKAFKKGTWKRMRNDLVGLSHYIGDGHQPLHLTENYNGQQTGNPGVHFRYEIELVRQFPEAFHRLPQVHLVTPSRKISHVNRRTFSFLVQGYGLHAVVNDADITCKKGRIDYDSTYYFCYEKKVGVSLRKQLARAATQVAAYWYSAWLEAGKPTLILKNSPAVEPSK